MEEKKERNRFEVACEIAEKLAYALGIDFYVTDDGKLSQSQPGKLFKGPAFQTLPGNGRG